MATSMEILTPEEKQSKDESKDEEVALILVEFSQQVVEEEEEEEDEDEEETIHDHEDHDFELLSLPPDQTHGKKHKKRGPADLDDSEETLQLILRWNALKPDNPPGKFFLLDPNALGECSRPVRKQLTRTDVKEDQGRLLLGKIQVKTMMHEVFEESEKPGPKHRASGNLGSVLVGTNGLDVSVYGPDGEVHEMKFKTWGKDRNTPVLMSEWNNFVKKYELKMHCDFITIWMFRHKDSRQICFAIDKTRFSSIEKKLSPRISKKLNF